MADIKQGIREFNAEKRAMEERLHALIKAETDAFYERTGVAVEGVQVGFEGIHVIGFDVEYTLYTVSTRTSLSR